MSHRSILTCLSGFLLLAASQALAAPPLMETLRGESPIQLQRMQIEAKVRGGLAETTVTMVFYNPNARPLEGNLQFPLLEGQEVRAFALDVDGRLRAAVPVKKNKGRQVFEDVERQQVDPALLEKTQGNNFRLRVYPIPAGGTRTVQLKYAEALARLDAGLSYRLPLDYGSDLREFDLTIETDGAGAPRANQVLGELRFERSRGLYRAHVAREKFKPTGSLQVLLPIRTKPQVFTQAVAGDTYFVAEIPVLGERSARPLPRVVGLLWDSSASMADRQIDAELRELDSYFQAIGNGEVRLTRLRDRAEAPVVYKFANGNWSALRRDLQATVADGASALAGWTPQAEVQEYLLLSDGLLNYGPLAFPTLAEGQRLYAINSSARADTSRLRAVAERSGGRLIPVSMQTPGSAAHLLLTEGPHLESLGGVGVADLRFQSADPVNGWLRIAGRLLAPNASVTANLSSNGRTLPTTLRIDGNSIGHPLAGHLWASYSLAALEAAPELQRAEIGRIGERFGLPTSETSLIVLDRVEDYVRHGVTPPPDLAVAYEALRNTADRDLQLSRDQQIEQVVERYAERIAWWEKEFPKGNPPLPARAPPPPPRAYAPASGDTTLDTVQVTGSAINGIDVASVESTTILTHEQIAAVPVPRDITSVALLAPGTVRADREGESPESASTATAIALKRWEADAPYMARLKAAKREDLYAIYLDERPSYASSTGFYLDVADFLLERKQTDLGLRVLSNLAEMDLENRHILRVLGYRLMQAGAPELAIPVFEKVLWLADDEPQSFRDLGNAHAAAGHDQHAIDLLYEVVQRPWSDRFEEVELIALAELNAIAARSRQKVDLSRLDPRLRRNLPLELRVVLAWDANDSDMDLWVTDPNQEKSYYGHKDTYQGGHMSDDFTGGYGPEEFSLRKAKPGTYKVEANYFGDRQQSVAGATTLQLRFTTGFGTAAAKEQLVMLRMKDSKETVLVGEFVVAP